jgi:hypothetical protein
MQGAADPFRHQSADGRGVDGSGQPTEGIEQVNINTMSNQTKPDWITDEQWKVNPNVYHWEQQRRGAESQAQLPPVTPQEALAQTIRLRNEKNWKQGE